MTSDAMPSNPVRLLPSQMAQSVAAMAIARILGKLDADLSEDEALAWHGLPQSEKTRLVRAASGMVLDYMRRGER